MNCKHIKTSCLYPKYWYCNIITNWVLRKATLLFPGVLLPSFTGIMIEPMVVLYKNWILSDQQLASIQCPGFQTEVNYFELTSGLPRSQVFLKWFTISVVFCYSKECPYSQCISFFWILSFLIIQWSHWITFENNLDFFFKEYIDLSVSRGKMLLDYIKEEEQEDFCWFSHQKWRDLDVCFCTEMYA